MFSYTFKVKLVFTDVLIVFIYIYIYIYTYIYIYKVRNIQILEIRILLLNSRFVEVSFALKSSNLYLKSTWHRCTLTCLYSSIFFCKLCTWQVLVDRA